MYVGNNYMEWLPDEEYEKLIDKYIPSEDMNKHLKTEKINYLYRMMQLICGSLVSLQGKMYGLMILQNHIPKETKYDADVKVIDTAITDIKRAIEHFEEPSDGTVYSLEDCWYDYDILEHKHELYGVYKETNMIIKEIESEMRYQEMDDLNDLQRALTDTGYDIDLSIIENMKESERLDLIRKAGLNQDDYNFNSWPAWYCVKKWNVYESKLLYTYYLVNNEVIWFSEEIKIDGNYRNTHIWAKSFYTPYVANMFMELSVPYKIGDCVSLDLFPFGPKINAVIFYISDFGDMVYILSKGEQGEWTYGNIIGCTYTKCREVIETVSPLYRISKNIKPDEEEFAVFSRMQEICSKKENASEIDKAMMEMEDGISTREVLLYLENLADKLHGK